MPGNVFERGTLLILSGPANHLHIIMNDPVYSHEHGYDGVLVVNISSIKPDIFHDDTCILEAGSHPFVRWPSWAVYKQAVVMDASRLDDKVDGGEIVVHTPVSLSVFAQVRAGFDASRHVAIKIKRFLRQHGL